MREKLSVRCQGSKKATMIPTLEACFSRPFKSFLFFLIFFDWSHFMCVVFTACLLFCALLSKHVCGTGKGRDGNAVIQTGYRHGSRPRHLFWDVVKHPYHRQSLTLSHHNKLPAICRSVRMPPSAALLATTTVLLTVWGHWEEDRMNPRKQRKLTKPHKNMLARGRRKHMAVSALAPKMLSKMITSVFWFWGNERP